MNIFNEQNVEVNINDTFLVSDFIHLSGAPDDAKLLILACNTTPKIRAFNLIVTHQAFEDDMKVQIHQEDDELILNIEFVVLKEIYQKRGLITRMLNRQVQRARALSFNSITLVAERSKSLNGYYTWARLGFNQKIDTAFKKVIELKIQHETDANMVHFFKTHFHECQDVLDLLSTEMGRQFWLKYGIPMNMEFDLDKNSKSSLTLQKYLAEKFSDYPSSE